MKILAGYYYPSTHKEYKHSDKVGQYDCTVLPKENGRDKKPCKLQHSHRNMEVGAKTRDLPNHAAHSRTPELSRRRIVKADRQLRLQTGQENIPQDPKPMGTHEPGLVCQKMEHPDPSILCLERTPRGTGCRCHDTNMAANRGICLPSLHTTTTSTEENTSSGTRLYHRGSTHMEGAGMVQHTPEYVHRPPQETTPGPSDPEEQEGRAIQYEASSSSMEIIRQRMQDEGISTEVADVMSQKQKKTTTTTYESGWRVWHRWNKRRGSDPIQTSIPVVLEFLHDKFKEGKAPSTIGVYKAALSNTLKPIDNYAIGAHPHVLDLYRGICNNKPHLHKDVPTWRVEDVIQTLKSWGPNEGLNLKYAVLKATMLLALVSGARCSEIAALDTTKMLYHKGIGIEFKLTKHTKTRKTNILPKPMFITSFIDEEPLLCPVSALDHYFMVSGREGALDTAQNASAKITWTSDPVLRRLVPPYTGASPKTISRWLTKVICETTGRTEPDKTVGHSVRGKAASQAAFNGLNIGQIMKAAEWQSESVFREHYFQPWFDQKFGRAVLGEKS